MCTSFSNCFEPLNSKKGTRGSTPSTLCPQAQFLDRQRLLVQWVAPELLVGPHTRHGSPHSAAAAPAHHAAYHMVYNMRTTRVESLFGANSQQLVEW